MTPDRSTRSVPALIDHLKSLAAGECPACHRPLPPLPRSLLWTCDEVCHEIWIAELIQQFGESLLIRDAHTGKAYAVPTRLLLEHGVRYADLRTFPEVEEHP